ncbi:preprotein translocase subunit SecA, partial [Clostridium algidicarnis]
ATNMAGRGTDIKLEDGVPEIGGLKIIGTERHESRRIDNQLRGRSGRQGDPGSTRFYLSLEDDLMRVFGSEKLQGLVDKIGLGEDDPIESKMVTRAIENAQKKVEGNNFDVRKTLLGYDDVMNQQREIIYRQRTQVLEGETLKEQIQDMIKDVINNAVDSHLSGVEDTFKEDIKNLINFMEDLYVPHHLVKAEELELLSNEEIKEKYLSIAHNIYEEKEKDFGNESMREIERVILLRVVDTKWMDHIDNMDHLKQGIGLRAYKQQDPTQAYQFEGSTMFEEMIYNIKHDTVRYLLQVQAERAPEREKVVKEVSTNYEDSSVRKEPIKKEEKIGRNDPCKCGSGKKYKNCCGREV